MYILKNAFISITRNKGRNILIGIIILVIACCSTITLAIKNTSTSLINSYKDAYEVEATIGFNRQNMKDKFDFTNQYGMNDMKENFDNMSSLTVDEVKEYADSDYVLDYYYTMAIAFNMAHIGKEEFYQDSLAVAQRRKVWEHIKRNKKKYITTFLVLAFFAWAWYYIYTTLGEEYNYIILAFVTLMIGLVLDDNASKK